MTRDHHGGPQAPRPQEPPPQEPPPEEPAHRASQSQRWGAMAVLAAAAVFVAGTLWALAAPGAVYGWPRSMISDLGATDCFATHGRLVCSPRNTVFNAAQIASGSLLLAAVALLRRVWGPAMVAAVSAVGLGLIVLGAFPSDIAHGWHMVGAVLALPVSCALLLVSGIRGEAPGARGRARALLGGIALVVNVVHLVPEVGTRGVAELISLVALILLLVLEAGWLLRTPPPSPRAVRPHAPR